MSAGSPPPITTRHTDVDTHTCRAHHVLSACAQEIKQGTPKPMNAKWGFIIRQQVIVMSDLPGALRLPVQWGGGGGWEIGVRDQAGGGGVLGVHGSM